MPCPRHPVHLLLVEDDEVDAEGFLRSMQKAGSAMLITIATDGVEALEILRGCDYAEARTRPNIVLLDLNLPRMSGLQFLNELRADPELSKVVVFVLTTSRVPQDLRSAYAHYVAGYLLKSSAGGGLTEAVAMLHHYARVVELSPS